MTKVRCINSNKQVKFILNGGQKDEILVFALQGEDFWFAIGNGRIYRTANGAKKAAVKEMAAMGYSFDEAEMKNLVIS